MKKQHWSSYLGFLLASIGSAIGLGNVWRYPYYLKDYGMPFLISSFIFLITLGIPLVFFELAAGRLIKKPIRKVIEQATSSKLLAIIPPLTCFIITSYYIVVSSWTLVLGVASFFTAPTFSIIQHSLYSPIATVIIFVLLYFVLRKEVSHGVELIDKYGVVLLTILLLIFFGYSLTLVPLNKVLAKLNKPFKANVPALALAQVFFSLSVGASILYTYSLYEDGTDTIVDTSLAVSISDFAISVIAGIMVISFLIFANSAQSHDTTALFQAIPKAVSQLPFSHLWAVAFFVLLFAAAFTSLCSMIEPMINAGLMGGNSREERVRNIFLFLIPFSVIIALGHSSLNIHIGNTSLVEFVDKCSSYILLFSTLVIVGVLTWKTDLEQLWKSAFGKLGEYAYLYSKYVIPLFILALLVLRLIGFS